MPDSLSALTAEERDPFANDVLERLIRSNMDYQRTHGHYIVPLSERLLAARADRDQAVRERDALEELQPFPVSTVMSWKRRVERADRLAAALDGVLDATENNNELSCEQRVRKAHQIAYDALAASQETPE